MRERFKEAFEISAYRFVTKPIVQSELIQAILDAVKMHFFFSLQLVVSLHWLNKFYPLSGQYMKVIFRVYCFFNNDIIWGVACLYVHCYYGNRFLCGMYIYKNQGCRKYQVLVYQCFIDFVNRADCYYFVQRQCFRGK